MMIGLGLLSGGLAAQQPSEVIETGEFSSPEETTPLFSFGLILLGIICWGGLRWYQHTPQIRRRQRQQVLVSMAALDERYARGAISESRYQQTRQRLKQRAIQLTCTGKND